MLRTIFVLVLIILSSLEAENHSKENRMNKNYQIRRSNERGSADHGWLKALYTFSFSDYYDPNFMGFRALRVINEDRIAAGKGFPTHPHKDMEIITVLLDGELAHTDSMNNEKVIREHEIQVMSAGSGVTHSEYNPSKTKETHLLQIWIIPDEKGVKPGYQQVAFPQKENEWILLASKEGKGGALPIHQDVKLFMINLNQHEVTKQLAANRYGWIQIAEGDVNINGEELHAGDGVQLDAGTAFTLNSTAPSKILFFDLN